jgi:hypothetical protein
MDIPDLPAMAFQHIGDRKIKPQGGGNPVAAITNPISKAIGTDGSGGGALGAIAKIDPGPSIGSALASVDPGPSIGNTLAAIDPGPAIGSGLADVDEFVNDEIPGGWVTVGLAAATAGAASGLGAAPAAAGGTTTGLAGGTATGTGLTAGAGASGGLLASGGTVGSLAGAGSAAGIAGTQAAAGLGLTAGSALTGTGAAIGGGTSTVGSLSPALPSAGSVGGAGAGLSAELAPGTILGTGLSGGGEIGVSYMLGTNGLPALNAAGQLIPASSVSFGGQAAPVASLSVNDALNAARLGRGLLAENPATPAGATQQFRGSTIPQGGVDYSGILNLLQTRAQQRNPYSLLG